MMAKCKDCLHVELCANDDRLPGFTPEQEALCKAFLDRSRYVVREKGEWEIILDDFDNELMRCPVCREEFYDGDNDTVDHTPNFCPYCGSDMRGVG
jgi:hypothetical protein